MGVPEPQKLSRGGVRTLLGLLGKRRFWGALVLVIVAASAVPVMAKVPLTLALSLALIGPLLTRPRSRHVPDAAAAGGPLSAGASFVGFRGEEIPGRVRWRQVRCVVKGEALEMASYWWRGKAPCVVPLANAKVTATRLSGREDYNLKRGQARVIEVLLGDGRSLHLAVDDVIAGEVCRRLEGH